MRANDLPAAFARFSLSTEERVIIWHSAGLGCSRYRRPIMAIRSDPAVLALIAGIGILAASSSEIAGSEGSTGPTEWYQPIIVAQNNSPSALGSNQQPQPCDCTNCSAEHCPGPNGGHYPNPWVPPGSVPFQPVLKSPPLGPSAPPKPQIQKAH
jgi:hypothetical protein